MVATQDITEKPVYIRPRNILMITVALVSSYIWAVSTFVTHGDFVQLQTDFQYHVESGLILQLQSQEQYYSDKLWDIQRLIKEPGGDTLENRTREREFDHLQQEKSEQIDCIQDGRKHCIKLVS